MPSPSVRSSRSIFFHVSRLYVRHLALVGLLALFGICHGFAQATAAPQSHPAAAALAPAAAGEQETAPAKDDASHQGIKVHGHWKIVVKNPDGSTAETREFENSYVGGGIVPSILLGLSTPGGFAIQLAPSTNSICSFGSYCWLVPNTTYGVGGTVGCNNGNGCAPGLTQTLTSAGALQLSGQITASLSGKFTNVSVSIGGCGPSQTASACSTSNTAVTAYSFTGTTISAVSVNAGQIVQVTVTISFS